MTPGGVSPLLERYLGALAGFLAGPDENSRLQAYELGRQALSEGAGILDIVATHHLALHALAAGMGKAELKLWLGRAGEFLSECLGPFEMSHRGYREANLGLHRLNEALERKNHEISQANQELEAFSYSVAHDLRAPLRKIDGLSAMLIEEQGDALNESGRQNLGLVRDSARRMGLLLENMLDLARFSRTEMRSQAVDLAALAREVMERVRQEEPARNLDFVSPESLPARGDPDLLGAVLENLLSNAWKFTRYRPRAKIQFGQVEREGAEEKEAPYFVRDNGAGFDMQRYDKLFKVFQRLHPAIQFEGTGVGLAIVQRIVERHGGRVWAQSRPDEGSTFYFTLAP